MTPRVIRLTAEWTARMTALERACFSVPWTEGMVREELENPRCAVLGVTEGERLLGYLALSSVLDEGTIDNVAVEPSLRRRGLGARLMEAALEEAARQSLSFVTLEVRESNGAAQALYRRYGFLPVGRRRRYYSLPEEDAILMTKVMKP